MRRLLGSLLIVSAAAASPAAFQGASGGSPATASIRPCAVLTRDLVLPLTQNPKMLDLMPPSEEAMSASAAACEYGSVRLQLYAPRTTVDTTQVKDLQPLSGVGDRAYFRSNRNRYAELMVWSGARYFTLQVSVPTGSTAEAIKPKVVILANQIIAKLK